MTGITRPPAENHGAAVPGTEVAAGRGSWWRRVVVPALLVVALTFAAYQPVWRAGFIWDDDILVTNNAPVKSADGLRTIWFSTLPVDYFPATSTVFWLQWRLWGDNALGYHLVNVLLHAAASVLWWRVLLALRLPGAWLAAAIFALHPVNVESVAWISELKNTLAMTFYTLAILAWLRADETGGGCGAPADDAVHPPAAHPGGPASVPRGRAWAWYWLSFLWFVLALLSKTAVAPFPLVILALAWWRRGRITWRDCRRSGPFFAASAVLALVTIWFQYNRAIGSTVVRTDDFLGRLAGAGWAVWFYLRMALLPENLTIVYPRWQIDGAGLASHAPGLLLAGVFVLCWWQRERWGRAWMFALVYFVAMLLPILGFFNVGAMRYSLVADRWQYFSIMAPIAVAVAGACAGWRRLGDLAGFGFASSGAPACRRGGAGREGYAASAPVAGALLLVLLGVLTWRQTRMYRDPRALWAATLARNPDCAIAHNEVGSDLYESGRLDEAIAHFRHALRVLPDYEAAHYNHGCALREKGDLAAAIEQFRTAVRIEPDLGRAQYNLGTMLLNAGQLDEAVVHLRRAAELEPGNVKAHNNLATTFLQRKQYAAAIRHYEVALTIEPKHATARNNLGRALFQLGRIDDAIIQYQYALELTPSDATVHHNLGEACMRRGDAAGAIRHFEQALELRHGYVEAEINLGDMLVRVGRIEDAIAHLRAALELAPTDADAHNNMGNALLRAGRAAEAIARYRKAVELQPGHVKALNNLGSALTRTGRTEDAISHLRRAVELQPDYAIALRNLGEAYAEAGRFADAATQLEAALSIQPADGAARVILARIARRQGRDAEALRQYERALELEPNELEALCGLAWMMSTSMDAPLRDGPRAVELAGRADRIEQGRNPAVLRVVAAAQAEAGRFGAAIATAQRARQLAEAQSRAGLWQRLGEDLKQYENNAALRDEGSRGATGN